MSCQGKEVCESLVTLRKESQRPTGLRPAAGRSRVLCGKEPRYVLVDTCAPMWLSPLIIPLTAPSEASLIPHSSHSTSAARRAGRCDTLLILCVVKLCVHCGVDAARCVLARLHTCFCFSSLLLAALLISCMG